MMFNGRTLFAGMLLFGSGLLQAYFDDPSCNNPDSSCIEEPQNLLKIKRISDVYLGDWHGQKRLTATNGSASDGKKFCILASNNTFIISDRQVRDYTVRLNSGRPLIRESGGSEIPITLKLIGTGPATSGINQNMNQGEVMVKGNNSHTVCRDYEFNIEAQVLQQDVLENAQPGYYYGVFSFQVDEINPARTLRSPDFFVELMVHPVAQVSQLKDVNIKSTRSHNGFFTNTIDFCAFTLGAEPYRLSLDTQNNPSGDFYLTDSGGRYNIPYQVTFKGSGDLSQVFNRAGSTHMKYYGDRILNCGGGTNASISIEVPAKQAVKLPSGIYQDVMKVTVEPM